MGKEHTSLIAFVSETCCYLFLLFFFLSLALAVVAKIASKTLEFPYFANELTLIEHVQR